MSRDRLPISGGWNDMDLFLDILMRVTLPIIALAALGFACQSRLKLDVGTLTRLQVNIVMPAFLIHHLSTGKQPLDIVAQVATLAVLQFLILIPLGWLLVIALRLRGSLGPIMGLGTAHANVGFYGIPVTQLAFGSEYLLHQSVLTAMMTILVCTIGVWLLSPQAGGLTGKLRAAFDTPLIPSVALGLLLRWQEVELPPIASQPLQLLGAIFTPLAIYTLGAQIAAAKSLRIEWSPQAIILVLKLLIAPLITLYLCRIMGVPGDVTAVMVVAAATPVGVLVTLFAAELKAEPEFIATATVITTALLPLTVTAWIIATQLW